jgi:hypothetical protein
VRRLVLILMLGLAAAGCGGDEKQSAGTTTVTTVVSATTSPKTFSVTTHGRFHYPDVIVQNYMRSCTRGDLRKESYCGCTLDKLSNDVSVRDFARVGASGGKLPPRLQRLITDAAEACAAKLP